jgi:type II secretory pathway component PulF
MTYPIFLLLISSIILIFLMTFVMPKVVGIFKGMKLALPWSTQVLIFVTYVISNFWWLLAIGALVLAVGIAALMKTEPGGRAWDRVKMGFPLLGRLHRKAVIARFTRTLSILLKSGIPLVDALEISRPAMGNRILEDGVKEATKLVGEGSDLATPLRQKGGFPPLVVQLGGPVKERELEKCLPRLVKSMKMMWRQPSHPLPRLSSRW